jgi:hypothetical protein
MTPLARYRKAQAELTESQNAFYEWVRIERAARGKKGLRELSTETGLTTQRILQIVKHSR